MRKLSVLLTITILSTLFLFISAFSKWEVHSILFQDEAIHIDYSSNDSGNDFATLIKELNEFSVTHDLNITQNNFVSQKKVNIYSTNFNDDRDYKMLRGSQPEKKKYASNRAESNDVTSGYLIFPVTLLDVRVFEFDQVNNVGISNTFYVDTLSIKAKEDFVEIFSKYGKVTFESTTESKTVFFEPLALIIFIMCYVILVIGLVFQLFHERKRLMLMVVWGYSQTRLTMQCLKHMMPSWIAPILIVHFGLGFYVIYFNQLGYFTELYFILLLSILLILISVVIASSLIIRKLVSYSITEAIQGKIRFKNMVKLFLFIKTVTIIVFVLMLSRTFTQVDELNKVKKGMAYWDNTQNIYTTIVGGRFDETLKDLKKDRKYNDRVLGFYHDLKKKKHGFIMVSDNFGRVNNEDGTWTYFYELDTQGDEEIYSPNGRRVTIDDNYLKVNEIVKANGEKINSEDFIIEDDVLNILVPYKQKLHEKDIIRAYKEWFYFYKAEVDNIYNEALKLPINRKSIAVCQHSCRV
ncbi:hypothetical protein [Fusibacter sp. JL216-2]|uniref:hypothetical protein n=1 Tax=Fusibacter sp. JL216-2 TaxID=3071453 RepID=UPI003D32FF86